LKFANDGEHNSPGKFKMAKKRKPKIAPVQRYEYLAERLTENNTAAPGDAAIIARLNELGAQGWQLVTIEPGMAWFMRAKV
jgi:hypothetical protein